MSTFQRQCHRCVQTLRVPVPTRSLARMRNVRIALCVSLFVITAHHHTCIPASSEESSSEESSSEESSSEESSDSDESDSDSCEFASTVSDRF